MTDKFFKNKKEELIYNLKKELLNDNKDGFENIFNNINNKKTKQKILYEFVFDNIKNITPEFFDLMEKQELDINVKDSNVNAKYNHIDLLTSSIISGNTNLSCHLINKGININQYFDDLSLLDLAVLNNDTQMIHKILENSPDGFINIQNTEGFTAVMQAAKKEKCKDALLTLLEYSPNLTVKTNNDENVLSIAQKSSDVNFNILKSYIQKSVLNKKTQPSGLLEEEEKNNTVKKKRGLL